MTVLLSLLRISCLDPNLEMPNSVHSAFKVFKVFCWLYSCPFQIKELRGLRFLLFFRFCFFFGNAVKLLFLFCLLTFDLYRVDKLKPTLSCPTKTIKSFTKVKDYPYRVSMILRKGTWWIVERAHDLRQENKPCYLEEEEEAEVLVSLCLPDQLLEHFVDPVHGSPSKGRKTVGVMSLHVDDLIISGTEKFLTWFLKIREHFTVGHEDKNDLTFTGHRVCWVNDAQGNKKYISIDQKLCVSELEEIVIPKHLKDADACDKALHTSYRSLLGSINWLQSRTQFQACYQRAMTISIADERVKNRRDTRGSLVFFERQVFPVYQIKRTTLSTTVAELYALMKCFGTCQMLRGLWKLRKEACSGAIADLSHARAEHCLSDCLTKRSANPRNLLNSVQTGWLKEIDSHPPFCSMIEFMQERL